MHLVLSLQNELITYYQHANRIHMQILYLKHFLFPKRSYTDEENTFIVLSVMYGYLTELEVYHLYIAKTTVVLM